MDRDLAPRVLAASAVVVALSLLLSLLGAIS
jgi:hypothetical protein